MASHRQRSRYMRNRARIKKTKEALITRKNLSSRKNSRKTVSKGGVWNSCVVLTVANPNC